MIHEYKHRMTDSHRRSMPASIIARKFVGSESSTVGGLRQRLGNQGIRRLMSEVGEHTRSPTIQTKLTVSQPGDFHEREADRVADAVMRMPESEVSRAPQASMTTSAAVVQRRCTNCEENHALASLGKNETEESGSHIHRKEASNAGAGSGREQAPVNFSSAAVSGGPSLTSAPPIVREVLSSPGQPLPSSVQTFFEPRFGADFSQVRVHTNAVAQQSAQDLNANAYTAGQNIVFGTGRFAPESQEGRRLLAHELTHVVQQSAHAPQGIVQRQMCTGILNAREVPGVTRGVEVERLVRAELIRQLGGENVVSAGLSIPGASSRLDRTEDCGGFKRTQPPGHGFPDLAFRQYPKGRTVELVEVKIGTWPCLLLAEIQVDKYVELADGNKDYKRKLGVDNFEVMATSRFTPVRLHAQDGTPVEVGWCSPGVIVYKAVAGDDKEDDKKPKDKKPKDKDPGPSDSLPELLKKLGKEIAPWLARAGLHDIGLALARVMLAWVSAPLAALAVVVLGIAFFWDEIKSVAGKIAGVARAVWDKISGLASWVRSTVSSIISKIHEFGIKLAELGSFLAGKIASLAKKLADGAVWVAGRIAAGGKWVGRKIASGAEAFWDWLWGSDVEPTAINIDIPITQEPRHCVAVAKEDTVIKLPADLLFPFNESELVKETLPILDDAAKKIRSMLQKDDRIIIQGYTDVIGSDERNQRLSEQRAKAVASWLVEQGVIPMSRILIEGWGKTRAQAGANDKKGREKDRRVDILVPKRGGSIKSCW